MRGAGFSDHTIEQQLRREGFGPYVTELALEFVRGELESPANAHHWHGH